MRLLALDTSTECCSVALLLDGKMRLRWRLTERSHAELVLPMVDELLGEAAVTLQTLDAIAFGRGPGAFTGLRIACGVAQGLALGAGLPVVPVSSLAAVAEQVPLAGDGAVLVCNDARMGEVYWGVYCRSADGSMSLLGSERVTEPARVGEDLMGRVRAVAGNALSRYPELRAALAAAGLRLHEEIYPRADAVARLGALGLQAGLAVAPELALPVYVRDDVARPAAGTVTGVS